MKWTELIIIRAADTEHRQTIRGLVNQLKPSARPDGLTGITLYRSAFVETDICIRLEWELMGDSPSKSVLGIELAETLKEFGRIHHTIWIDDETKEAG